MSNEFIETLENSFIILPSQKKQYMQINRTLENITSKIGNIECMIRKQNHIQYTIQNKETNLYLIYYNYEISFVPKQNTKLFKNHSSFLLIGDDICITILPYKKELINIDHVLCIENNAIKCIYVNGIIRPNILTIFKYNVVIEPIQDVNTNTQDVETNKLENRDQIQIKEYSIPISHLHIVVTNIIIKNSLPTMYHQNIIDYSEIYKTYRSNSLCYLHYIIENYDNFPKSIIFLGNQTPNIQFDDMNILIPIYIYITLENKAIVTILDRCISTDEKKIGYRKISKLYKDKPISLDSLQNEFDYWKIDKTKSNEKNFNIRYFWCTYIKRSVPSNNFIKYSSLEQYGILSLYVLSNTKEYYQKMYNGIIKEPNVTIKLDYLKKTFFYIFMKK